MRTTRTKRRKALRLLLRLIALVALLVALMPVWFPWALKPLLSSYGIRFQDYDRIGYWRFSLVGVKGAWPPARFEAAQIKAFLPTVWLWQRLTGGTRGSPLVTINDWGLKVESPRTNRAPTSTNSLFRALDRIVAVAALLQPEVPVAELTDGVVETDSRTVAVPIITWRGGRLTAELRRASFPQNFSVAAEFNGSSSIKVSAALAAYGAALRGRFTREPSRWRLEGEALWLTNRADLSAQFTPTGWWPAQAQLTADAVHVPAELVRLKGYEGLTADLALNLVSNRFDLQASGLALPAPATGSRVLPKVEAVLHVHGNPHSALVDRFQIQTPWLHAELTNTVGIGWSGALLTNTALLQLTMDLAQLPGASLTGTVEGLVSAKLRQDRHPMAQFDFASTNVRGWGMEADRLEIMGALDWPVLKLDRLAAHFSDASEFEAEGAADVHSRTIAEATWRLGGMLPQKYFPGACYSKFEGSGRLKGSFTNLTHSGEVTVEDWQWGPMKLSNAQAGWEGRNLQLTSGRIEAAAGASVVSLAGGFHLSGLKQPTVTALLENASLRQSDGLLYVLQRPCGIAFQAGSSNDLAASWSLTVDGFEWRGNGRSLSLAGDVAWPGRGRINASVEQMHLSDFSDFVQMNLGTVSISQLGLDAHWSNGPVRSVMTLGGYLATRDGQTLAVNGSVRSGETVEIDQLCVRTEYAPALVIDGTVPLAVMPGRTNGWLLLDSNRAIALRADLEAVQDFAFDLGSPGKLEISQPRLHAIARGTLERPSASLELGGASLVWHSTTNAGPQPRLEQFQLDATISPDSFDLRRLTAKIDGQPIQAQGQWPVPAELWKFPWPKRPRPDWSEARGRLQIEDAEVASLARYLPGLLAPEGRLKVDLVLEPGGQLDGMLVLTNASTRPLGKLTPLRDVTARVRFDGQQASLEEFQGQIGGQPVRATGRLRFLDQGLDYELNLQGSNVPLARTLEFLLRGDFNLRLQGGVDSRPMLSGEVTLQDGLYVQHTSSLMTGQPERPGLRPPYFSVTNEPFANWKLDLTIGGNSFLRVRTPVFNAIVSANLKLLGTLREPESTGDARLESGRIIFPFGTLKVDQAYASLTGHDPRGPDLLIHASGRSFRYDVRLEVNGPADGAQVTFSSTPPLSSEEILLMLTAGELPRDEYSFSTEARAGRLATFLGRDILSRFAGDNLAGERLIINTGENISEEGKTTYSIEYRLTDRWSIIGEYDRFSALNAAVKWKVYSR